MRPLMCIPLLNNYIWSVLQKLHTTWNFQDFILLSSLTWKRIIIALGGLRLVWLRPRLVGLVVKASAASGAADPGFDSDLLRGDFSESSQTGDLQTDTPVAILPGAWRYRVSAGTSWPSVTILWLCEVESLTCSFCLGLAARKIVWADPSPKCASMLLGR